MALCVAGYYAYTHSAASGSGLYSWKRQALQQSAAADELALASADQRGGAGETGGEGQVKLAGVAQA